MDGGTISNFLSLFIILHLVTDVSKVHGFSKQSNARNNKLEIRGRKESLRQAEIAVSNELEQGNQTEPAKEYDSDTDDETKKSQTRPLVVGDTFTPHEMLIISSKLMSKLENPGEGKGFVSSAQNVYELTDKLFEAFFMNYKRIVVIRDVDIPGLDALQALALSGEVVNRLRTSARAYTESPAMYEEFLGPITEVGRHHCRYKLLEKPVHINAANIKKKSKRRQVEMLKKSLGKNRTLIVNPGRRGLKKTNQKTRSSKKAGRKKRSNKTRHHKSTKKANKNNKHLSQNTGKKKSTVRKRGKKLRSKHKIKRQGHGNAKQQTNINGSKNHTQNKTIADKQICRWRYACGNPTILSTCRLHTVCVNDTVPFFPIKHGEEENTLSLRRFRKMVGIDIIDEEVEKILERHILALQPFKLNSNSGELVESLSQYFIDIISEKRDGVTTTSSLLPDDTNDLPSSDLHLNFEMEISDESADHLESPESSGSMYIDVIPRGQNDIDVTNDLSEYEDPQGRRILGLIPNGYNATGPPEHTLHNKLHKPYNDFR